MARLATRVSVKLNIRQLAVISKLVEKNAAKVVEQTCRDIAADAKSRADVITGAMRASVYLIVQGEGGVPRVNTYTLAATQARGLNPRAFVEQPALPESGKIQGVVGVSVNYAQYEEIARGHKFLLPAADSNRPKFQAAMTRVADV
jgi:hypothetical protein